MHYDNISSVEFLVQAPYSVRDYEDFYTKKTHHTDRECSRLKLMAFIEAASGLVTLLVTCEGCTCCALPFINTVGVFRGPT